jgi:hypothetical protein
MTSTSGDRIQTAQPHMWGGVACASKLWRLLRTVPGEDDNLHERSDFSRYNTVLPQLCASTVVEMLEIVTPTNRTTQTWRIKAGLVNQGWKSRLDWRIKAGMEPGQCDPGISWIADGLWTCQKETILYIGSRRGLRRRAIKCLLITISCPQIEFGPTAEIRGHLKVSSNIGNCID